MPYNQRSFALKHHHGTRLFLCHARRTTMLNLDKKYHYAREPTRMAVRWTTLSSSSCIETSDSRLLRWVFVEAFAATNRHKPRFYWVYACNWVEGTHHPAAANRVRILPTEKRRAGWSRVNERKESREAAITSQVAVGLIARTLGLPNWGIEKETRGD